MAGPAGYLDLSALAPRVAGKQGADRMFIVGRSGSGKSYLARSLLELYDDDESTPTEFRARAVVFDPNGTFVYPGKIVRRPEEVAPSRQFPVIIYRPGPEAMTAEAWNEALQRLFHYKGRLLLLIDEFTALDTLFQKRSIEGGNFLTAYMGRGRALGKAAIIVTQAPASIPLTVIRNAERFAIFDLPLEDDRDRMAGVVGRYTTETRKGEVIRVDLRERRALGKFQFWYSGPGVDEPVRIRVRG
jgi:energy-coupling factor transporter ATP-binding protein EcfA2